MSTGIAVGIAAGCMSAPTSLTELGILVVIAAVILLAVFIIDKFFN